LYHGVGVGKTCAAISSAEAYLDVYPRRKVIIIAPWNYPFQLALSPAIAAYAAGNQVVIKPSELTPTVSQALKEFIEDTFLPKEVSVVLGDGSVAAQLTELPFNHIFFTGSPAVGKLVMASAAKNLTSVTLELGGKSPVVVGQNYDLEDAAKKILWGKCTLSKLCHDYCTILRATG
jgi:aldehyde dehydrogenase (NAD+)